MAGVRIELKVHGEIVQLLDKSDPNVRPSKEGSRLKISRRVPNRVLTDRAAAEDRIDLAYAMLENGENMHPRAQTLPATDVGADTAKLWGYVSSKTDATCKFVYWLDGHEDEAQEIATSSIGNASALVEATIADLDWVTTTPVGTTEPPTMTWYYKVVVTDKYGVEEGYPLSFETT